MEFKELKKRSKHNSNIDALVGELEKQKGKNYNDERFWSAPIDEKTGNGVALIRFLPASADNSVPWTSYYAHSFQGPGGWYIENSLSTLGQPDPLSELNSELWNSGIEANKDIVRKRKRSQRFVANILVLEDPKNPENEGKVFLFRFGKKIFGKIQEKLQPEFEGDDSVDVFDFWNGANFKLKVRKLDGYPNYDSSYFENPSPLFDGEDAPLEKLWKSQYDLREFTDPKNFKTYDQLKQRLDIVLGNKKGSAPKEEPTSTRRTQEAAPVQKEEQAPWDSDEVGDDATDFFKKLAEED